MDPVDVPATMGGISITTLMNRTGNKSSTNLLVILMSDILTQQA